LNSSKSIDYREALIPKRLSKIKRILMVASGKGGVGKSMVSATIALVLSDMGYRVGLLDLDFHGPSSSVIFGVNSPPREEKGGLVPPESAGVKVMSIDLFVAGRPVPIGGAEKREVIKEILALTDWGELDYLVVDMPPETGDVLLTSLNNLEGDRHVILVTIPSILSHKVVSRLIKILKEINIPILGLIENMAGMEVEGKRIMPFRMRTSELAKKHGVPFLGSLPIDPDAAYYADSGEPEKLRKTIFTESLREILSKSGILI